ncbi:MAG: MATE family efflux transporter [Bacilli bacterium]
MKITNTLRKIFTPVDLTKGSIWKVIVLFSIPILISVLFQQFYTLSDAAIVGQTLGSNEVAGINNTTNLVFLVLQFAFGCTAGFSVITSKKIGSKDNDGARKSILVQIFLCLAISIILTIGAIFAIDVMLNWLGIFQSADVTKQAVYEAAATYLFILFLGITFQMFFNLIICILRSLGDSVTPLCFLILSTLLNIALDFLFIVTFKMGVAGAAVATIISQSFAATCCFIYTFIRYKDLRFKKEDLKFSFSFVLEHLKVGLPLAFQFSILSIGLIVMQGSLIKFDILPSGEWVPGTPAQLGYGAGCKVINFMMCPFNALGTAMLSYCGQNYGAKEFKRIKKGTNQALIIMMIIYAIVLTIGLLSTINGGYQYIFLSPDKISSTSISYGNIYIYTALPLFMFLGALFVLRNCIQGIGKSLYPFLAGIGELFARLLICMCLPPAINGGPINSLASPASFIGLALADPLAWIFGLLCLSFAIYKFIYKQDYDIKDKIEVTK